MFVRSKDPKTSELPAAGGIDSSAVYELLGAGRAGGDLRSRAAAIAERNPGKRLPRHRAGPARRASSLAGWQKAEYYGRRAAAQARRTAAHEEAIEMLESSLEVTPAGTEERALLLIDLVDLFERCGRNPEAVLLAEEADGIAEGDR